MSRLRAREIYSDSRLTLFAVESIDIQRGRSDSHFHFHANVQPVALVVRSPGQVHALDMDAVPMSLEQLIREVPELASLGDYP